MRPHKLLHYLGHVFMKNYLLSIILNMFLTLQVEGLYYVLQVANGIEEYKIIQDDLDKFLVQIVTLPSL